MRSFFAFHPRTTTMALVPTTTMDLEPTRPLHTTLLNSRDEIDKALGMIRRTGFAKFAVDLPDLRTVKIEKELADFCALGSFTTMIESLFDAGKWHDGRMKWRQQATPPAEDIAKTNLNACTGLMDKLIPHLQSIQRHIRAERENGKTGLVDLSDRGAVRQFSRICSN